MFDLIGLMMLVVILLFGGLDLAERLMFVEGLLGAPVLEWAVDFQCTCAVTDVACCLVF